MINVRNSVRKMFEVFLYVLVNVESCVWILVSNVLNRVGRCFTVFGTYILLSVNQAFMFY